MSDNKPTWQIKQVNVPVHPQGEWLMAQAFNHHDAVSIGRALADYAKRERWRYPVFEVEAPDGQRRRFGDKA